MMLSVRIRKEFGGGPRAASPAGGDAAAGGFKLDVAFDAPPGVTILFGASGSGKTLTLKAIAGLVRPDSGHIRLAELTLFDSSRRIDLPIRLRGVGYVFQNLALFPHLTALGNVEFPLGQLPRAERRARALSLLEKFGIGHAAGRLPRHISGGEAQRVALARALAAAPRLLLLDEPLSALDEPVKLELISDLKALGDEMRLPIIYVTHNRDEALALGERALIYERGRIVAEGAPTEVFQAPANASVARLTGVENIFEGQVLSRSEETGTMMVEVEGAEGGRCRVEVPLGHCAEGGRISLAVRSGDILLATSEPGNISARNVLAGRIEEIEERGAHTLVRVACGVPWVASVTRQSLRELELSEGKHVWLAFKTYSCRVFEAGG
ncbi:MAG: ATP-binding cassette domain-containing protein [Acidobacteria bacterium]|nr:ATP-binding cassette domain-containing protein [Acidobacteriota bacterium]